MLKLFLCLIFLCVSNHSMSMEGQGDAQAGNNANDLVKCYGIADFGQNENVINPSIDGHVYGIGEAPACHPQAYISLPRGTDCSKIIVGQDAKLSYVRGSGEPNFKRPQVDYCYPYNFEEKKPMFPNPDWRRKVDRV